MDIWDDRIGAETLMITCAVYIRPSIHPAMHPFKTSIPSLHNMHLFVSDQLRGVGGAVSYRHRTTRRVGVGNVAAAIATVNEVFLPMLSPPQHRILLFYAVSISRNVPCVSARIVYHT